MVKKLSKNSRVISIDWTDVEAGKGGVLIDEGNYEVKTIEVEQSIGDKSGEPYLKWQFEIISSGEFKGKSLYYNTSLQQKSLWNLRGVLEVLGIEIPDGPEDLDLDELIDRTVGVEVQHEIYEGKPKSVIVDFFEFKEESEEKPIKKASKINEEEEKLSTKKTSKKLVKKYTEDELLEKDEDELENLNEEHELDVNLDELNSLRRKRAAIIEALEEKGLVEEAA